MRWFKNLALLVGLYALARVLPSEAIDSWGLLNPRRIVQMVFAIALIQAFGVLFAVAFGTRAGTILTGILGGLVSSTAVTASLARNSKTNSNGEIASESLLYFSATFAMLIEALLLVAIGAPQINPMIFVIFSGPLLLTAGGIAGASRAARNEKIHLEDASELDLVSIGKLSAFIILVLALSKIGQKLFGRSGLLGLTFLISLFEIHAPVIANVQLERNDAIDFHFLGGLLCISLAASYLSKLFIIYSIGSSALAHEIRNWTIWIFLSLLGSWFAFLLLTRGA